jgi:hypothetical protein
MKTLALFLVILLLAPIAALAASTALPEALPSADEYAKLMGTTKNYENRVYGYTLNIPAAFYSLTDDELKQLFDGSGTNDVYDMRYFISGEYMLSFEVQVKVPSYSSFTEECANAAAYIDILKSGGYTDPFLVHEGIVRQTPIGSMLEMAYGYMSDQTHVNVVYYDYYLGPNEYIFYLEGYEVPYEVLQPLLKQIVDTAAVTEAGVKL